MKLGKALVGFIFLSCFYLGILIWIDSRNHILNQLHLLVHAISVLMCLSFCSYVLRYIRWHWLLSRSGYYVGWGYGFLGYLAGFAFTATPGKVGELIRIRYFTRAGVPSTISFGAFVYERALDLIVVLILSALVISRPELLILALSFVTIFVGLLAILSLNPILVTKLSGIFSKLAFHKLAKFILIIRNGLASCRMWFTPIDLMVSFTCGFFAWGITSYSFMWLLNDVGISIEPISAFTIYPLAMLSGAASMLPGGVGSTELTIVLLLSNYAVPVILATLSAIAIRFTTIWFAVLTGFICLGILEIKIGKSKIFEN